MSASIESKGIKVILNASVVELPESSEDQLKAQTVKLADASTIEADMVLKCFGAATASLCPIRFNLPSEIVNEKGLINVTADTRVIGFDNLFAVGNLHFIPFTL